MTSSFNNNFNEKTLRIGIMCNELSFSAWEAETIRHLINTKGVSIELLIGNGERFEANKSNVNYQLLKINLVRKVFRKIRGYYWQFVKIFSTPLWQRYQRFVNVHYTVECDKQVSMLDELINIDMIYCSTVKKGKYSQYFTDSDIEKIQSFDLDIILRFGFNIIRGEILNASTYGVWSFHHGDYQKYRGGPPGFWEIYNKDKFSGAILQRLTDKLDDGIVLYQSAIKTDFSSYTKNKNNLFWSTTKWPSIVCRKLLSENNNDIFVKSNTSNAPIYKAPTNLQFLKYLYISYKHKIITILRRNRIINRELWAIGIIDDSIQNLVNKLDPPQINWINPPPKRFYADPFFINKNGTTYIFFEDFSYELERGRISYIETKDFKNYSTAKPIIDTSFHMSYPFMVEDNGKYYCIPEQHTTGEISLYEAVSFPDKWNKKATILKNFHGIDPTLFKYNNTWWMFIANQKNNDSSKLYLFYSKYLEGPWKPHKKNPVKIFPNMTRPAGNIFESNGKLIRPAQNCTKTYGGSTLFYEIEELSKDRYRDRFIGELLPNIQSSYPSGLHHVAPNNNITIVDGKK